MSTGEFIVRKEGDRVIVERADPEIQVGAEFLELADPQHVHWEGPQIRFTASNGVWVYKIIRYDVPRLTYHCVKVSGS